MSSNLTNWSKVYPYIRVDRTGIEINDTSIFINRDPNLRNPGKVMIINIIKNTLYINSVSAHIYSVKINTTLNVNMNNFVTMVLNLRRRITLSKKDIALIRNGTLQNFLLSTDGVVDTNIPINVAYITISLLTSVSKMFSKEIC